MTTFGELSESFPPSETFKLGDIPANGTVGTFTDNAVSPRGFPLRVKWEDEGPILAQWRLEGRLQAGGLNEPLMSEGEIAVLVTKSDLRCSFFKGSSPTLGTFNGGFVKRPSFVLVFRWPLTEIDCITSNVVAGKLVQDVQIRNLKHDARLHVVEATAAQEDFGIKGLGLSKGVGTFARDLIRVTAERQADEPDRKERSQAVLRGDRDKGDGMVTAWFVEEVAG